MLAAEDVVALLPVDGGDPDALEYRMVTAEGTYVAGQDVVIRRRTFNNAPGYWVLTPLALDDGRGLLVNRGWFPVVDGEDDDQPPPAPSGEVRVAGMLRATETASGLQSADPEAGVLRVMSRADINRVQQQVDLQLLPLYLQLAPDPDPGSAPFAVPLPEQSDGPHLSYAVQWFIFTTIALVGYPLIVRKIARERARRPAEDRETGSGPDAPH